MRNKSMKGNVGYHSFMYTISIIILEIQKKIDSEAWLDALIEDTLSNNNDDIVNDEDDDEYYDDDEDDDDDSEDINSQQSEEQ